MAFAGRIKCDYCDFMGELQQHNINKSALSVPLGWISIHPTIVVHGMRGLKSNTPEYKKLDAIKVKVKEKVATLHCCPKCASDREVFDIDNALPAPPERPVEENHMKRETT